MKKVNINFYDKLLEDLDKEIELDETLDSRSAIVRNLVKDFVEQRKQIRELKNSQ